MRRAEWQQQALLSSLLSRWLDHSCAFATAVDNVAASATAGAMRRRRGVARGLPDTLIWCRYTNPIAIELKGPGGRCTRSQKEVRAALLRANCVWWEARSAAGAMWALTASGVPFREGWIQPRLEDWEVPRRDPAERRAQHPAIRAQRREYARRRRARTFEAAAERDAEAMREHSTGPERRGCG
jgi:hypothetical protein